MNDFPEITINAHSSIRIAGSKVLYFDPYLFQTAPHDADVIFLTHDHYDHESAEDIEKVSKPDTIVVRYREESVPGITVRTVPAYNPNKKFHPKENHWVGYLVTMDGVTYYVAGDTDETPELLSVQADVALLPVGGTYTMTAEEAAEAAKKMSVPAFIPTHYGAIVGDRTDGERFRDLVGKEKNVVLKLFR